MKKNITIVGMIGLIICTLSLISCSRIPSAPNEKKIENDLPEELTTIHISYDWIHGDDETIVDSMYDRECEDFQEIQMQIEDVVIEKRQTNDKEDNVFCNISMSDPDGIYEYTGEYRLYYNYYDQGGWILDDYEEIDGLIQVRNGISRTKANSMAADFGFSQGWDSTTYIENHIDDISEDKTIVNENYLYKAVDGDEEFEIEVEFEFFSFGSTGEWYAVASLYDIEKTDYADETELSYSNAEPRYINVDSYIDFDFIENFPLSDSFDTWELWLDENGYKYEIDESNYIIYILSGAKNDWYMDISYNTTNQNWNNIIWGTTVEENACMTVYDACKEELMEYYGDPIFEPGLASWFSNGLYGIGVIRGDQYIQIQVSPEYVNIGN